MVILPDRVTVKRKIVLVGDPSVGKTSLVRKYVTDQFSDNYLMTVGFKVSSKKIIYEGVGGDPDIELNLMIWDIMGQKGYSLVPQNAFYGAKGAIMVCDLTRKETMLDLTDLTQNLFGITDEIPIIFMANKMDLEEKQEFDESSIADFAAFYKAPYFMTSAKLGNNVQLAFSVLGRMMLRAQGI